MKRIRKFYGGYLLIVMVVFGSCKKHDETPSPAISGVTPMEGSVGTTVTLSGKNLSSLNAQSIVEFNDTPATVTTTSSTELIVTVPTGASTGKITITLNGKTATSPSDFTVIQAPVISSFSPSTGVAGTQVIIAGSNFSSTPADNVVTFFDNQRAVVTAATSTQLTVTVPAKASTGKIIITTNGITSISASDFTVITSPPTIITVSPAYGVPGATVTITGTNFATGNLASNSVKFNGTDAIVAAASGTQLSVTVPSVATTGKIKLDVNGQTATSTNDFEVLIDIPRDGLVAFYPFSGNANDVSGHGLNGTAKGNASLSTDRYGNANKSYSFDGTNSYIDIGNPTGLQISNKITVAGWVNINVFNPKPVNKATIIMKIYFDPNMGGNSSKGYEISQDFYGGGNGPSTFVEFIGSSSGNKITSVISRNVTDVSDPVLLNNWIFFALVIDGVNAKFYKNGIKTDDVDGTATLLDDGTLGNLYIGTYDGGFYLNGKVDDVTIYNKPLDATAILKLYNQTATKY